MLANKICPGCGGQGEWWAECCNGAGGCSCHGQPVYMGMCNVCNGKGEVSDNADTMSNVKIIEGACFIGSGPSIGYFANRGKRLNIV